MSTTAVGGEMILATVMEGGGNGNKDEFLYLAIGTASDGLKDDFGRMMGIILASTKGMESVYYCISIQESSPQSINFRYQIFWRRPI